MNRQLLRLKQRSNGDILQVAESDDSNNLYVNVATSTPIDIDGGTIDTVSEVAHVTNIDEVDKAVLYGTDKAGTEWPVLINDEGQLDTVRMQDSSVVINSYVTFPVAAAQYTTVFSDIVNPDNETYDYYNLYITNPFPNILTLSIRNNNTNVAGITSNHEIYTAKIPAAPYTDASATAWSSCFTSIGGVLVDESGDWSDNVPPLGGDVPFAFAAVNDAIYFGHTANFRIVVPTVVTAGVYDATFVWEYWNGSAWTALPNIQASTGTAAAPFKSATTIGYKWTTPADWTAYDIPGNPTSQYWVRCRCTAFNSITTAPVFAYGKYVLSRDIISHVYKIESMFNGGFSRITLSNDSTLATTQIVPVFYTLKKY